MGNTVSQRLGSFQRSFHHEHEAKFSVMYPLCAAKYKEFVKQDEATIVGLKDAIINTDEYEVSLRLGELDTTIRFVEIHFQDIKTILKAQE